MNNNKKVSPEGVNTSAISPKLISVMIIGMVLLIILVQIGFSRTYIQFFPKFERFKSVHHFHGMMMMGWLLMLLVQPILILKGKIKLHRRIGALSYVLAPLVVLSMYLITQFAYHRNLESKGEIAAVARLSLNFPLIVFFAALYLLAIFYKHKPALHMRFMCSTAFLLIGPGLSRALRTYLEFARDDGVSFARNFAVLIAGTVAIADSFRIKRISPFTLVFGFMILHKILWDLRETAFWQNIGNVIAKLF
jgi:hypothetical protein